jgi:hypothetical protein
MGRDWISHWTLMAGRAFVAASAADCATTCVYMWAPDGTRTNLSTASPIAPVTTSDVSSPAYVEHRLPIARAGHVLWWNDRRNGQDSYTLYEVATGTYREITLPAGVTVDFRPTLAVAGGEVRVHYVSGGSRIYRWDSGSGTTTLANDDGASKANLTGDDTRVAWIVFGAAMTGDNVLYTMPVIGGATTQPGTVYTITDMFQVGGGLLAWDERPALDQSPRVRVLTTAGTVVTLGGSLQSVGDGRVIYVDADGSVVWDAATADTRRLLRDGARDVGGPYLPGGNAAVFTFGRAVYFVPL